MTVTRSEHKDAQDVARIEVAFGDAPPGENGGDLIRTAGPVEQAQQGSGQRGAQSKEEKSEEETRQAEESKGRNTTAAAVAETRRPIHSSDESLWSQPEAADETPPRKTDEAPPNTAETETEPGEERLEFEPTPPSLFPSLLPKKLDPSTPAPRPLPYTHSQTPMLSNSFPDLSPSKEAQEDSETRTPYYLRPAPSIVTLNVLDQSPVLILARLLETTGAKPVQPTAEEREELEAIKQVVEKSQKDRMHVAGIVAERRREEASLREARGEILQARNVVQAQPQTA